MVFIPCFIYGKGSMNTGGQKYTGIFHNITPGRIGFRTVSLSDNFYLNQVQTIDAHQQDGSIRSHAGTYSVNVQKILYYDNKHLFFILYLYEVPAINGAYTVTRKGIDVLIKDEHNFSQYITLKEFDSINSGLSFAKTINNKLFFSFSDNHETVYTMELGSGKHEISQYSHPAGEIQNIWLKAQGGTEYIFTLKTDERVISGIFKITGQDNIEPKEIYNYQVVGYDTPNNSFFYYNHDNILSYRNGNDLADYTIGKFMGRGETLYDIFFLEDGSFILASTKNTPDHISDFFFGRGNQMHYFYYYHAKKHKQSGNFIIKKIRSFGGLWKLEQLILY
jgi:hypothetical protein